MDNAIHWELEEGWTEATIERENSDTTTISMYHDEVIIDGSLLFNELEQVYLKMRELQPRNCKTRLNNEYR